MTVSTARIVVQATPGEKEAIAEKARSRGVSISELMRRGAAAYEPTEREAALEALADEAARAAERAGAFIDKALEFIEQSKFAGSSKSRI